MAERACPPYKGVSSAFARRLECSSIGNLLGRRLRRSTSLVREEPNRRAEGDVGVSRLSLETVRRSCASSSSSSSLS